MKKEKRAKQGTALLLVAALLAPNTAYAASAKDFSDFPSDWSAGAMTQAVENGLLGGYDGKINPQGKLTRAEMAAIINRAFGAREKASLAGYIDVSKEAWYYEDMAKAVQMGTFVGAEGGKLYPTQKITREEAFVVLARAFDVSGGGAESLSGYSDAAAVSSWARQAMAAMVEAGYVGGFDGKIAPQAPITRAEFAAIMSKLVQTYITAEQTVTHDVNGTLVVRDAGVTLKNMTVSGDLVLADGIGKGGVVLDGVTVKGRVIVRGGEKQAVQFKGSRILGDVIVCHPNAAPQLINMGSSVNKVVVKSATLLSGDLSLVEVCGAHAVQVSDGTVKTMVLNKEAVGSRLTVDKEAVIEEANVYGARALIEGQGCIKHLNAEADRIAVTIANGTVYVGKDAKGVTVGGKAVQPGQTVTLGATTGDGDSNGSEDVKPSPTPLLADGVWYGTGTWSREYEVTGGHVVKVTVKDHKIQSAETVSNKDDHEFRKGENIVNHVTGLDSLETVNAQLKSKNGDAYDAVSSATQTAYGQLSAIQSALDRSKKYAKDGVSQDLTYMDMKTQPKSPVYYGDRLDLSDTVLNVRTADGKKHEVVFKDLATHGIVSDTENGVLVQKGMPGLNASGTLNIRFTDTASGQYIYGKVVVQEKQSLQTATHIRLTLSNGKTQDIALNENNYYYTHALVGGVTGAKIYAGTRALTDGVYNNDTGEWEFNLAKVPVDEGHNEWKYKTYQLTIDSSADQSPVASFTLDAVYVPTKYGKGDVLYLDELMADVITEQGSRQRLPGWKVMQERGFSASPDNGTTLDHIGVQEITIRCNGHSETLRVQVVDYADFAPAKVELCDGKTVVQTVLVNQAQWENHSGLMELYQVKVPTKYEGNLDTLTVKVSNGKGTLLEKDAVTVETAGNAMVLRFPQYQKFERDGGMLSLNMAFEDAKPSTKTATGNPVQVGSFGYQVTATVTVDTTQNNKITDVRWQHTDAGAMSHWTALFEQGKDAFFEKFIGLDSSNAVRIMDSLKLSADGSNTDAVSGATVTSAAVRDAVKDAYEKAAAD